MPYIIPMCFGYHDGAIYLHSAVVGRKIDVLRRNNNVCFEFDVDTVIRPGENACNWSMHYQSVVGFGKAEFVTDVSAKREALSIIMSQYADGDFTFPEPIVDNVAVFKIVVESITGKQSA